MARGWESKSVEEQIAAAEEERRRTPHPQLSPDEQARKARRGNLNLARARVLQDLQAACDRRHRAMLEQALVDLDAQLAEVDSERKEGRGERSEGELRG